MRKLGIVTFYYESFNFGGVLQAYALVKYINTNFDVKAEQICYQYKLNEEKGMNKALLKERIKQIISRKVYKKMDIRKAKFIQFENEIPHSVKIYDDHSILSSINEYDIFVCGGDQIWNDFGNGLSKNAIEIFSLQFVPDDKLKFSYAPSIPSERISQNHMAKLKKGINRLNTVSVREQSSVKMLCQNTEKNIEVVIDPVLLLTEKQWDEIVKIPKYNKPYILCYFLGADIKQRKMAERYAKKLGLDIITFAHVYDNKIRKCDMFFGDIRDYSSGPKEFVGLIKNATLVLTDSFHACVFSLIYETPFYAFQRQIQSMGNRITDLLSTYSLEEQYILPEKLSELNQIPVIDFKEAKRKLEEKRAESVAFLEDSILSSYDN